MKRQKRCQMVVWSRLGGGPRMLCRIIWAAMSVRRQMEGLDRVASRSRGGRFEDPGAPVLDHQDRQDLGEEPTARQGLAVRRQGVEIEQRFPAFEQKFNGLITNDKFCLSRTGRLALSWWRYPLRRRDPAPEGTDTVPDLEGDRGGGHETPLAGSPSDAAGFGRRSAVGSGLHAHSELGSGRHGLGARGGKRHLPTSSGGEP
jgi:hypothetical protein